MVNDRVDVALLSRANGVHLGNDDIPAEDARKLLGKNALIGISTHTRHEASKPRKRRGLYTFGPGLPQDQRRAQPAGYMPETDGKAVSTGLWQ